MQLIDENRWYNFDDSHISPINEDDVKSSAAYVLFYRRVRTEDAAACNGPQSSAGNAFIELTGERFSISMRLNPELLWCTGVGRSESSPYRRGATAASGSDLSTREFIR
ncbi:ubiquitin carboxyl-terminal hydrolase 5 isoform X1 [Tanacetum coccineum]